MTGHRAAARAGQRPLAALGLAVTLLAATSGSDALEINTATLAELEQMSGFAVAMAGSIPVEREKRRFRSWEDLEQRAKGTRGARAPRLQEQGAPVDGISGARARAPEQHTP